MDHERIIFAGTGNPEFAYNVAESLGDKPGGMSVTRFPDGEVSVKVEVNVRGRDCFVIQPTCPPDNENLLELMIIMDALRRSSAYRVTAVIPYYGYARQDRKDQPRVPITAKLVANLLARAGADRVLTMDLHAGQIQGFFDIPVDNLAAAPIFAKAVMALDYDELVVASPDVGGVKNARSFARRLERMRGEKGAAARVDFAVVDKHRKSPDEVAALSMIGDVDGKHVVIIDDIVSTGGSLVEAASLLLEQGAIDVVAAATHPILAGEAVAKIEAGRLEALFVTDTVPLPDGVAGKIKLCSVAGLFGAAIEAIHHNRSISRLFDGG